MIITMCQSKGGAGKSCIAVNLASEWMSRGLKVLVVDTDPQGTALTWAEIATENERPTPTVVAVGDNLRQAVPAVACQHDVTIIDTAGRQSKRLAGALMLADLALVPCQPAPADIWAMADTVDTIATVQQMKPELQAVAVINKKARTMLSRNTRSALENTGLSVLSASLGSRVAFAESMATGLGVTSYLSNSPAASEIRNLADEISELYTIKEVNHAA
jgi:chromosome partitioning protein